jgi:predicted transcriptional regulator
MKGVFINDDSRVRYGWGHLTYVEAIMAGIKTIETRSKNMLRSLVGERVAVVSTGRGRKPMVVGTVYISDAEFIEADIWDMYREDTLIPYGSKYDNKGKGKWGYILEDAQECEAFPLPANAIRHGRSWCEF